MNQQTRDSMTAIFSLCLLCAALALAIGWTWASFTAYSQDRPGAVAQDLVQKEGSSRGFNVARTQQQAAHGKGHHQSQTATTPQATEAQDAAFAHAHAMAQDGTGARALPKKEAGSKMVAAVLAPEAPSMAGGEDRTPVRTTPSLIPVSLPPKEKSTGAIDETRTPRIAIIIDDMGLDRRRSARVVDLPGALTLSYLPYANDIQAQVDGARNHGHEIMLHLPMEPLDRSLNPGPNALTTRLDEATLRENLKKNLSAFKGYVGVNNHMGSRLTSTPDAMETVLGEIERKGVYFVDSWTSPRSVAYQVAASLDMPRGRRDVFLDHYEGQAPVWDALKQAERIARRTGHAVVIGHPRSDTIAVLQAWLPGAMRRGVEIVPMSDLLYEGAERNDPVLLSDAARGQGRVAARSAAEIKPAAGR